MAADSQQAYAKAHEVPGLLQHLLTQLVIHKPADPLEFIAHEAAALAKGDGGRACPPPPREAQTEDEAGAYVQASRLEPILEQLTAALLVAQPPAVLPFVEAEARRMRQQQDGEPHAGLFTDDDLQAMFSIFDPAGSGRVSSEKFLTALKVVGVPDSPAQQPPPAGAAGEAVSREKFVSRLRAALREQARQLRTPQAAA